MSQTFCFNDQPSLFILLRNIFCLVFCKTLYFWIIYRKWFHHFLPSFPSYTLYTPGVSASHCLVEWSVKWKTQHNKILGVGVRRRECVRGQGYVLFIPFLFRFAACHVNRYFLLSPIFPLCEANYFLLFNLINLLNLCLRLKPFYNIGCHS